eukprot:CAMPEP_0116577630 /NCGR_PEP_ID=MMETSP0397-20121206/21258_1 /TAXON_ID=216820 /ORGANISM="Cyclophora tenuis, Strain ECT3854" /LENGTH=57 /DNA_ID=CAMNT_0004106931 /DNA_START=360 /DNA_END=533 /DNA_ORIENTATION=+
MAIATVAPCFLPGGDMNNRPLEDTVRSSDSEQESTREDSVTDGLAAKASANMIYGTV